MTIEEIYNIFISSTGVSTDTRSIESGNIFFALKGGNFNGNLYAGKALSSGAKYAVIDESEHAINDNYIVVKDALTTLQQLAKYHRQQLNIPIIAVTGSNGKTTTKELLEASLSSFKNTFVTPGNLNNHIGVPLSILKITKQHDIAILELGDNHVGEVKELCKIALPDYGLVTNIGKDHLEGFGSMEMNIKAKAEIFDYLAHNHGKAFVDLNDQLVDHLSQEVEKTIYYYDNLEFSTSSDQLIIKSSDHIYSTHLFGLYNEQNVRCAVTIALYFGGNLDAILTAISNYQPSNNRSQVLQTQKNKVILDAYNANPSSVSLALKSLSIDKNTMVILGDMFELGEYSDQEHRQIIKMCKELSIENAWFIGHHFANCDIKSPYKSFSTTEEANSALGNTSITGKTILIKGSRGMTLETLIPKL